MSYQPFTELPEKSTQRITRRRPSTIPARFVQGESHSPILQLQRTLGNRRVAQLIQAKRLTPDGKIIGLQPKLTVGAADDQYEQEADRVAHQVASMPDSVATASFQQASSVEEENQAQTLQSKPLTASITPFVQRQMAGEEEIEKEKDRNKEEDKDELLQAKFFNKSTALPLQRQLASEEEKTEPVQTKLSIQRDISTGEEDKDQVLQTKGLATSIPPVVQRQTESDEESEDKETQVQAKFLTESSRGPLQRQPATGRGETESIQAKSAGSLADSFEAGDDVESRLSQSKGSGSQLPDAVRTYMEPRFGVDFGHVRVHTGSNAIQMNQDVGAQAFTHGSDIYYGAGQSTGNLELTAHELTHVVQQTGSVPSQPKGLDDASSANIDSSLQRTCSACNAGGREGFADPDSSREAKPLASAITTFLQTKCSTCEQETELQRKESKNVQRKPSISLTNEVLQDDEDTIDRKLTDSVENRLNSSKGSGDPLPENLRTGMESAFNADFSAVKVHINENAVQMNRDLGAKAFTHGNDIYFNGSNYNPYTNSGKTLLAHELTHVVQQSGDGFQQKARSGNRTENINQIAKKDVLQLAPNVTGLDGPAEMPAGQGSRVTLTATAARGTAISWSFVGANNGAALGGGTGRTNTLTAPAGSTGGVITVQAADAANAADVSPPLNITLVEIQQPTFALNPPPAVILPAGAAFPANTVEASVCGNNATAAVVTAPVGRAVTWSIVGNRRGATIDPATGIIIPSVTETGNIVIRATDNALAAARNQQTLTVRAHPRRINNTIRTGTTAAAGAGAYGSVYDHIFQSSGGGLTGVNVSEHVFCGSDPFNFCPGAMPVLPGLPNVWTLTPAGRMVGDFMLTGAGLPGIDVNRFLPSPPNPGLPQVLTTPQILYWRSEQCGQWIPFENVPIEFILRRRRGGGFETITINNRIAAPSELYTGPALAAGAAPAASVCGAGEGLSNISFNPGTIAADSSALTTTAATVRVRPGGNLITWSFPGPNFGANIVAQGNPALFSAGNIAGQVRVRAAMTATPGCFTEGWLRMQEIEIGPGIRFRPNTVRAAAATRATTSTKPGSRVVTWAILPPVLGAAIVGNPDNSATINAGAQIGRITVRASDQRDPTRFADASLVIN